MNMQYGIIVLIVLGIVQFVNGLYKKQPNIVVIMGDDMGYNDVGFHGNNAMKTPNIDALGYNGIILNNHYALPSCTPSRGAFLTGNYPIRFGFQGEPIMAGENRTLPLNMPTMAQRLKQLGYKTHLVGKWHLGAGYKNATPTFRGFDTSFGYWNGYIGYYNYLSKNEHFSGADVHDGLEPAQSVLGKYCTEVFTQKAESVINNHERDKPLFLMLAHLATHTGYDGVELAVQNETANDQEFGYIKDKRRRLYAGVMKSFDDSVGRVVKALATRNILDNTIILVFSDNGGPTSNVTFESTASNWPYRGIKMGIAEGGIKSFAVIWSKHFKRKGIVNNDLIHITDWLPTFYAAAGADVEKLGKIDGINQWATLVENVKTKRSEFLVNIDEVTQQSAMVGYNGTYKLIEVGIPNTYYGFYGNPERENYPSYDYKSVLKSHVHRKLVPFSKWLSVAEMALLRRSATVEDCRKPDSNQNVVFALFDLKKDPCETTNVAEKHPEVVKHLSDKLEDFRRVLVPQQNTLVDPCSNPKFFEGFWSTWLSDPSASCQGGKVLY